MGVAARASIENRTWENLCSELVEHYEDAIRLSGHSTRARAAL